MVNQKFELIQISAVGSYVKIKHSNIAKLTIDKRFRLNIKALSSHSTSEKNE